VIIAYYGSTVLIYLARDFCRRKPSIVSFRVLTHRSLLLLTTESEAGEGVAYLKSVCVIPYFTAKGLGLISNIQPLWWTGMVGRYYPRQRRAESDVL